MTTTIRIDENLKQQLKLRSVELKTTQTELLNQLVKRGLEQTRPQYKGQTIEEINKILESETELNTHGIEQYSEEKIKQLLKEDKKPLSELSGIIKTDTPTNAVYLKKESNGSL